MLSSLLFATYTKVPFGSATTPFGPCLAPAVTCPLSFSTPVVRLRVNDDTIPSLKLVTNASAPVPGVGVEVGVLELLLTGCSSPLLLQDAVLSIAAMITTAGISRMMFLIVFRRDEDGRLRSVAIQTPSFGQPIRSKKQQRVKYHNLYAASNRTVSTYFDIVPLPWEEADDAVLERGRHLFFLIPRCRA